MVESRAESKASIEGHHTGTFKATLMVIQTTELYDAPDILRTNIDFDVIVVFVWPTCLVDLVVSGDKDMQAW